MEIILCSVIGIVVGFVVGLLYGKNSQQKFATQCEVLRSKIQDMEQRATVQEENYHRQLEDLKQESLRQQDHVKTETIHHCQELLEAKEEACNKTIADQEQRHKEAMDAQQVRFNETLEKVTAQLKNATDEMLKQRQKEFEESSNANLGQIVNPLRETIDKMKVAMNDNTIQQTKMSSEMKTNIEYMMKQSAAAQRSAEELTRVFKHGSKVQGDWGETVLNELLESQGLTEGIQYDTQAVIRDINGNAVKTEDGNIMRPDVILHLDQRREVIIDSKVSLTAFMDYANAENEDDRQRFLKAHVESIQKHVKELSVKDYSSYIQPPKVKMDYVIMFVPHTGALWTALKAQPDLWRKAMDKNVFIADEQTLFAALRIINMTWTQIAQAQNHEKVYALANEMLDRVGQFMKKYQALGKALDSATKAYDDANRKLQPTGQSILVTCAKLEKLGAKQSDKNPLPQIADIDDIPSIESDTNQ